MQKLRPYLTLVALLLVGTLAGFSTMQKRQVAWQHT